MLKEYKPTERGRKRVQNLKEMISGVIQTMGSKMPDGREKALFITKLEEAAMFGTKAILSKKDAHDGELEY